ncbi:MAG: D-glycero-beta-D-manno-heptose-7-phosphate kinase [Alphaproteobacteria bacterium]|nr:D-glycero-beta-D-manno-heptose-7-phosphate kinase [Alphaproteobacteria bacterium]
MLNLALMERISRPARRIVCVGDLMLDRFVYGKVGRISPEAPIPVLSMESEVYMLGGAGNVVRNIAALGAEVRFVSVVGDDSAGVQIQELLAREARVESHLLTSSTRPTTFKTRFIAQNQQMLRVDAEDTRPLPALLSEQLFERASDALGEQSVLVLSDYGKGVLGDSISQPLIAAAGERGVFVIVDPKGRDYRRYAGAHLLTPNRKELAETTSLPVATLTEIETAARKLIADHKFATVLVTLSEDGMLLVSRDEPSHYIPTRARRIFDVSGAGDTVVASLSLAIAAGLCLTEAAELANLAAGIVVGKPGTAVCTREEVLAELVSTGGSTPATGSRTPRAQTRYDLSEVSEMVAAWRTNGARIGFTNGCFDVLHGGHIALLAAARSRCDRLIVGVNSDASVKRLKGESRPLQSQQVRAQVLAVIRDIDAVLIFDEDTPLATILALRPELLVKGADYSESQVVGAAEGKGWGGTVYLAQLEVGQSTTRIIETISQKI